MAGTEIHIRDVMTSNIRNICSIFSFHSTSFGKRDFKNRGGKEGGVRSIKYYLINYHMVAFLDLIISTGIRLKGSFFPSYQINRNLKECQYSTNHFHFSL